MLNSLKVFLSRKDRLIRGHVQLVYLGGDIVCQSNRYVDNRLDFRVIGSELAQCVVQQTSTSVLESGKDVVATVRVPVVFARDPWQVCGERCKEIVERPSNDDVVEKIRVKGDQNHGPTNSCKQKKQLLD